MKPNALDFLFQTKFFSGVETSLRSKLKKRVSASTLCLRSDIFKKKYKVDTKLTCFAFYLRISPQERRWRLQGKCWWCLKSNVEIKVNKLFRKKKRNTFKSMPKVVANSSVTSGKRYIAPAPTPPETAKRGITLLKNLPEAKCLLETPLKLDERRNLMHNRYFV